MYNTALSSSQKRSSDQSLKRSMVNSNPEALARLRHSAAHVLAQAVLNLYPGTKLAIGPAIKDGFYYDFDRDEPFTEEDLAKLEAKMEQIVSEAQEFSQRPVAKAEAEKFFKSRQEPYKLEILSGLNDGEITLVQNGPFIDLCRGNHIHNTKELAAIKLLSIAGAYWRGSERNKMLQRVYGTAFFSKEELTAYLNRLEESKKRDHRKLGKQLDLFSFHVEAPGMPFYHPKGMCLYETLVEYWREEHRKEGYLEIKTPVLLKDELWKQSGHYDHYKENMFFSKVDDGSFAVKPMNCPGSTLVYRSSQKSYRNLPLKLAELGLVHRRELSGVLHGLFRVNAFTIDDAHIFCTESQIEEEISKCIALIRRMYHQFGFEEIRISLSTRPKDSMGGDDIWNKAIAGLKGALASQQLAYDIHEGGGAFYGPKIDFEITDSIGREWQCGTIQLDFQMPERFNLSYIDSDNHAKRPVMVHRAVFGSVERFYGVLVEHYAGQFPVWLAPEQVRVLTISEKNIEAAQKAMESLKSAGIRVAGDLSSEKIGYKIRNAELDKIPYIFVIGNKEAESGKVAVRLHGGKDIGPQDLAEMIFRIQKEIKDRK
ncbi:MAG: threonine--tRNA ligase [Candidatus Omnitrophica bacterium]|nr:threonine--tRNA ligase [Candidatus Omnitrophota bacterium]